MRVINAAFIARITAILTATLSCHATAGPVNGTSVGSVRTSVDGQVYWIEELARGLKYPSSLSWLPSGAILITERQGGLRVFHDGGLDPDAVIGVPASFQDPWNGLREAIVDPDFSANHQIYLHLSEGTPGQVHTAVYRARYEHNRLTAVERIFRSQDMASIYITGRMLLLPDKTLLVDVTDTRTSPRSDLPQRLDSYIGKILRINLDGSVPADNPFVHTPNALPEIWSYGHRIVTGLYWDPETQSVWEVEPGPVGGDELNVLKAGGNFGWTKATWGFEYDGGVVSTQRSGPGIEDPIIVWMPAVTPAGITRYRGSLYPAWNRDFFVGHLSGRALERLRIVGRSVLFRESMLADLDERIREVRVGPDNHIYVLTDHENGRLLRLNPGRPRAEDNHRVARALETGQSAAPQTARQPPTSQAEDEFAAGKKAFLERCAGCHSVGTAISGGQSAPNLGGVYGRRAGSAAGFAYSGAMAASAQIWSDITLNRFLADPRHYIPGTAMQAASVSEPDVRRRIITFIKQSGSKN